MPPAARADLTSRSYMSQRLRLHYVDWGNAGAPPLILLHGGLDHCRSWDWVADDLRRDFHVIAPDLRGHGDSQWSPDANYSIAPHIYDLAQLIDQQTLAPVTIVAHSFGGFISARYAGIYPETVAKLVLIEGLGEPPPRAARRAATPVETRWRDWIGTLRDLGARHPRRYATIDEALARMRQENGRLSAAQARHLTVHGISQNEDGSYSWKFDNYVRSRYPIDIGDADLRRLWGRIGCPVLLLHGSDSWAADPRRHWPVDAFPDARVVEIPGAGHWVHHDRLDLVLSEMRGFLLP